MRLLANPNPPKTERFSLVNGQPAVIALQYVTGKLITSPRSGLQDVMYTLADGRRAFFPLAVAAEIDRLQLAPGERFKVCHRGRGDWEIDRLYPEAPPRYEARPAPAPPQFSGERHSVRRTSEPPPTEWDELEQVQQAPAPAPRPASTPSRVNGAGEDVATILARCYSRAIDIQVAAFDQARSKGLHFIPTAEALQACSATLFIAETKGSK